MQVGIALVESIQKVHERKYIHRDIKPENFIVGSCGDQHKIYLIDYGLAKLYLDSSN
jgi:serine/threonine protein kinase